MRLAQRFAAILHGILAFLALASRRSDKRNYGNKTISGARIRKKTKWTTLIIDSQAVKNTCSASAESNGFCLYKSTNEIKRRLAVDTLEFPFFTHCNLASLSDDWGLIEMLEKDTNYFKTKPVNIPKITILLAHSYHPEKTNYRARKNLSADYDQNQV